MKAKKVQIIAPKKSDAKKQKQLENSKVKTAGAKLTTKKKRNEFGDPDSL